MRDPYDAFGCITPDAYAPRSRVRVRHLVHMPDPLWGERSPMKALSRKSRWAIAGTVAGLVISGGPVAIAAASPPNPRDGTVRVALGETLSAIASRYHTNMAGLAAANRISNPNLVYVGEVLHLSGGGSSGAAASAGGALPSDLLAHPSRLALRPVFVREASAHGVPVSLLEAVCWWESGWQAGVVSSTGAIGVCQIEPSTAAYVNDVLVPTGRLDVHAPADNITMAAALLHQLLLGAGGNVSVAVGAYYQGLSSVQRRGMLRETRAYVHGIRTYASIFAGAG